MVADSLLSCIIIQFEVAQGLENIVSGNYEDTKVVIDYRALPIILELLKSKNDNVREQVQHILQ